MQATPAEPVPPRIGIVPRLAAENAGFSAFTNHSVIRRASVVSGHVGRAIPSSSRVGKRIFFGRCNIAASRGTAKKLAPGARSSQLAAFGLTIKPGCPDAQGGKIQLVYCRNLLDRAALAPTARACSARAQHRSGYARGPVPAVDQNRVAATPCAVQRRAVIQSADINMRRGHGRLAGVIVQPSAEFSATPSCGTVINFGVGQPRVWLATLSW